MYKINSLYGLLAGWTSSNCPDEAQLKAIGDGMRDEAFKVSMLHYCASDIHASSPSVFQFNTINTMPSCLMPVLYVICVLFIAKRVRRICGWDALHACMHEVLMYITVSCYQNSTLQLTICMTHYSSSSVIVNCVYRFMENATPLRGRLIFISLRDQPLTG